MVALVALAAFLVGFSKAGVAGTLGPFVTVLMALAIGADDAVGLLLPILIIADWFTVAAHWRHWDLSIYRRLLAAAAVGIVIGSFIISTVDEAALRRIIAISMLVFAVFYAFSKSVRLDPSKQKRNAWPAGVISGVVSTLAHLGGPPIFVYLMTTNLSPRRFVATSAFLFASINLLKVPGYFAAGLIAAATGAEGVSADAGKQVVLGVYSTVGWYAVAIGVGVMVLSPLVRKLMHLDTLQDDTVDDDLEGAAEAGLEAQEGGIRPSTRSS